MRISLKDSLRWIERDGKKVLQVLTLVSHLDQNGQGTYEHVWNDVPVHVDLAKPGSEMTVEATFDNGQIVDERVIPPTTDSD
jgi:hypothetical protein